MKQIHFIRYIFIILFAILLSVFTVNAQVEPVFKNFGDKKAGYSGRCYGVVIDSVRASRCRWQ